MFKKIKNEKGDLGLGLIIFVLFLFTAISIIPTIMYGGLEYTNIEEKIEIKALSDNSEISGEIEGSLIFTDGEINENTFYRLELFNPNTKLAISHKIPATLTKKYLDVKENENPYVLLKIKKYSYEDPPLNDRSLRFRNQIPEVYLNFLPENLSGELNEVELHLPEDSIADYITVDTK